MIPPEAVFVLGAQDPEMREIERVLDARKLAWVHASVGGRRCSAMTAYQADGVVLLGADGVPRPRVLLPQAFTVWVECGLVGQRPSLRVDHHHKGDPGFHVPPGDFLKGSSLGQVLGLLGQEPNETQRLLAASDHCLTAAYQGQCPGVDPDELLFLRASWKAHILNRSLTEVMSQILEAARAVRRRHDPQFGEAVFADPSRMPAELAEGAAYAGLPVRYRALLPDGRLKEMFKGGSAEAVTRFMARREAEGWSVYGNPHRGYAGAYSPATNVTNAA